VVPGLPLVALGYDWLTRVRGLQDLEMWAKTSHCTQGHDYARSRDIRLAPEELLKITNWVDTNAQYHGSYFGRRNLRYRDLPDFRPVPTLESALAVRVRDD